MQHPQAQEVLGPIIRDMTEKSAALVEAAEESGMNTSVLSANMTLRSVLSFANLSSEMIDEIDKRLKQILNRI
jgi:hypothetical protein